MQYYTICFEDGFIVAVYIAYIGPRSYMLTPQGVCPKPWSLSKILLQGLILSGSVLVMGEMRAVEKRGSYWIIYLRINYEMFIPCFNFGTSCQNHVGVSNPVIKCWVNVVTVIFPPNTILELSINPVKNCVLSNSKILNCWAHRHDF